MADEPEAAEIDMSGEDATVQAFASLLENPKGAEAGDAGAKDAKQISGGKATPAADAGKTGDGQGEAPVTEGEGESAGDQAEKPVIAAPSSWTAEAREAFSKLDPALQRVIVDRDAEQTATFQRQVTEAAERRKAADAELQAASNQRREYAQNLEAVMHAMIRQTAGEFADIKSPEDLERMAQTDPQRYVRWQARRDVLLQAQAESARLQEEQRAEEGKKFQGYLGEQRKALQEKYPEILDPVKGKAIQSETTAYLQSYGFSPQEIGGVVDHRMALVIRDALAYRKGQDAAKTAAAKKVAVAPSLAKPGGGGDRGKPTDSDRKGAYTSIARHGTTDQQAEALAQLLETGS